MHSASYRQRLWCCSELVDKMLMSKGENVNSGRGQAPGVGRFWLHSVGPDVSYAMKTRNSACSRAKYVQSSIQIDLENVVAHVYFASVVALLFPLLTGRLYFLLTWLGWNTEQPYPVVVCHLDHAKFRQDLISNRIPGELRCGNSDDEETLLDALNHIPALRSFSDVTTLAEYSLHSANFRGCRVEFAAASTSKATPNRVMSRTTTMHALARSEESK